LQFSLLSHFNVFIYDAPLRSGAEDSDEALEFNSGGTSRIYLIRGEKVMLDRDLATLYAVSTKVFNQAVKRQVERFPPDFMFQLTVDEAQTWWLAITANRSRSQSVTLKRGRNIKYRPHAFTEHGRGIAWIGSCAICDEGGVQWMCEEMSGCRGSERCVRTVKPL